MSLAGFLGTVVRILDDVGVPYMLTGSLAAAHYALPRATQDIDLVIDVGEAEIRQLVNELAAAGLYVSGEAALEAFSTGGQFNAIDPETGWKADLIVRKDRPFSATEFARRTPVQLLGVEVALTSIEDLVIAKLEWSHLGDSERQRRDLVELLGATWDSIDHAYIESWVARLRLQTAWNDVLARYQATDP